LHEFKIHNKSTVDYFLLIPLIGEIGVRKTLATIVNGVLKQKQLKNLLSIELFTEKKE